MFTGTLALLHRALKLDARLYRTHLFRFSFAAFIYIALLVVQVRSLSFGAPGLRLFESMTWLNLALITLAGVSFFSTAITEEKEEETIGLLKMAGLNPVGILLGKSTSRLIGALLLLFVQFPFTLLAITLGGVTLGQVFAAYVALAAYMILLANIGLLSSVACRRGGNASAMTVLMLGFYFGGEALFAAGKMGLVQGAVISPAGGVAAVLDFLSDTFANASIYNRINQIMMTGFAESAFSAQALGNIAVAAIFFGIAWLSFDFFTEPRAEGGGLMSRLSHPIPVRRRFGSDRPRKDALLWKEFHFVSGGWRSMTVKFVLYGLVTAAILTLSERYYSYHFGQAGFVVVVAMLGAIVVESSIYASRLLHDEWRERTLPILMMLPVSTSRILYSKVAGYIPALLPASFWLFIGCVIWPDGLNQIVKTAISPSYWFWGLIWLLFLTLTVFFSLVVRWGALPLAVTVMIGAAAFGSCCFSPLFALMEMGRQAAGMEGAFFCVDVVVGLLIAGLQFDVHRRVEIVAGT